VTLGVFASGLGLVWLLGGGSGKSTGPAADRTFVFALNDTASRASVRSPWQLGHMTPQDDKVELTLVGSCATAHLYAYLSTGWDHGPLNAASLILGTQLHPRTGPAPRIVRHNATSAVLVNTQSGRGVAVRRAGPRNYNALVVEWQTTKACQGNDRNRAARELGHLFESFAVVREDSAPTARLELVSTGTPWVRQASVAPDTRARGGA
jgi:hypothetical protein